MKGLWNLSINQIHIIAQLPKAKGIRDLARKNSLDPAAVSRMIKDAEDLFGFILVTRSQRGVSLTSEGMQISQLCIDIIRGINKFEEFRPNDSGEDKIVSFVLGSRGYLSVSIAGFIAEIPTQESGIRFKFIDTSPSALFQGCLAGAVDIAIHFEDWAWPSNWSTKMVGSLTWGIVVRAQHPIKAKINSRDLQKFPFITASYLLDDHLIRIPDSFPLRLSQRQLGHESQTAFISKAILMSSNHVAFLPLISMKNEILSGEIRVVKVTDMEALTMPLRLSCHMDRVSNKAQAAVALSLEKISQVDDEISTLLRV